MTEIIYVVTVRGLVPTDLSRKVIEVHAKALKSRHYCHTQNGKDVTPDKAAVKKKETAGA